MREAIESVLAQEGVELELRVYDNGSTDGSVGIVESYLDDPRVVFTRNERDLNYFGSLNRALDETRAEYFAPFAADDVMLPGNLALKVAALDRFPDAGFVHSPRWLIDAQGARTGVSKVPATPEYVPAPHYLEANVPFNLVAMQAVVARTAALRAVGGLDSRCMYCGDWLAWLLLSLEHGVVTIDRPLIEGRVHEASGTTWANGQGFFARDFPAALERALAHPACPPEVLEARDALLGTLLTYCASELANSSQHRAADGWASYVYAGLALAHEPLDPDRRARYLDLVRQAGLTAPALPLDAVAVPGLDEASLAALAGTAADLARRGLLGHLTLLVDEESMEASRGALEAAFSVEPRLAVDVVPGRHTDGVLVPGTVLLAPEGDPGVAAAEAEGIPAFLYARRTPFDGVPDPGLYQVARPDAFSALVTRVPRRIDVPRKGSRPVVLVVERFHPEVGGVQRLAEGLGSYLLRAGRQVAIATNPSPERASLSHEGMTIHELTGNPLAALDQLVSSLDPAAIVGLEAYPTAYPTLATLVLERPGMRRIVKPCVNEDAYRMAHDDPGFLPEYAQLLAGVDAFVVSSHDGWDVKLAREVGVSPHTIPNAASEAPPGAPFRPRYGIREEERLLLVVANFWPEKNHLGLIEALERHPGEFRVVLVGDDSPEWPELGPRVREAAARDPRIVVAGPGDAETVASAMAAADLLLLPSKAEATPLVLVEASGRGLPWLATPTCGSARDLAGGVIVPVEQFPATAEALLEDPARRAALAEAGRAHWERELSWERVGAAYLALIDGAETQRQPLPVAASA